MPFPERNPINKLCFAFQRLLGLYYIKILLGVSRQLLVILNHGVEKILPNPHKLAKMENGKLCLFPTAHTI